MNRVFFLFAVCSLACLTLSGCGSGGPSLGSVTGQVTMDGKPLPNVLVTFVPEGGGRAATGTTNAEGQYQLVYIDKPGALIGNHKVSLTTLTQAQGTASGEMSEEEYEKAAMAAMNASAYDQATVKETIPARYNTQTELIREVKAGKNVIDLELTSEASGS